MSYVTTSNIMYTRSHVSVVNFMFASVLWAVNLAAAMSESQIPSSANLWPPRSHFTKVKSLHLNSICQKNLHQFRFCGLNLEIE